jgi:hypothetical protein
MKGTADIFDSIFRKLGSRRGTGIKTDYNIINSRKMTQKPSDYFVLMVSIAKRQRMSIAEERKYGNNTW